jgi:hypothetical protein
LPHAVLSAVLCSAILGLCSAQIAKRRPSDKGPRAIALLEVAANGKAHLVPVTIMINGKFYDAGVYKADPVPMALQSQTIYEGFKAGVSQGLFTVSGAGQGKQGWFGYGKWKSNADIDAEKAKAKAVAEKRAQKAAPPEQEVGGPPKLKRGQESSGSKSPPPENPPPKASKSDTGTVSEAKSETSSVNDANRPILRRQPVSETAHEQTKSEEPENLTGPLQSIPAVSDADGPEPRSYVYPTKTEDEPVLMKKMLAMAGDEVNARAEQVSPQAEGPKKTPAGRRVQSKAQKTPEFHDVQMRILDLSSTNEAVLVLTAQAKMPNKQDRDYMTAVVARQDIYGDLHKVFAQTTDNQHLDVVPRYEFLDAVDANGDGRGDLLFRLTSDSGSAFSIYSVIGDRLWPLFEGKPGR